MSNREVESSIYRIFGQEERIKRNINQDPIVALVDTLFYQAVELGASDIHIQPCEKKVRIRFRIDGILYDHQSISLAYHEQIVARLKILASMDIAQRRLPQDGKYKFLVTFAEQSTVPRLVDVRIATFPSLYGEKVVLRLLDRSQRLLSLTHLGFSDCMLNQLRAIMNVPHGLFLVTGPTGAGKTTTLYAMLSALNQPGKNIVTLEDPIEYELEGITQTQVNTKAGLGFENGLRSLVRQDPDIMMIGEIRDIPTADIAVEAALTEHLIVSTLHTNDAIGAVTRLLDMQIEPFLVSASLIGVLAQRLVRVLCPSCKKQSDVDESIQELALHYLKRNIKQAYAPVGCRSCFKLGYKGRVGIFELLLVDDYFKEMISQKASLQALTTYAQQQGMITFILDGLDKVEQGLISQEEFLSFIKK